MEGVYLLEGEKPGTQTTVEDRVHGQMHLGISLPMAV